MAEEQFDFDELIARRGTRSLKWDIDQDPDVIELWSRIWISAPPR